MRIKVLAFAASLVLISNCLAGIPQSPTTASSTQAASLLAQSAKALTGSTVVNDVTLTGTAERIAGSDDETGTVTYKAILGSSRLDLSLSNGTRSEIRAPGPNGATGNWIGPDGTVHEIPQHNLLTDTGWFPIFTFTNSMSATNGMLTYVGQETKNGVSVIHISYSQQFPNLPAASVAVLWQHCTRLDIYLNASTLLPVALDFNTHPDDNEALDIPVEFLFSDYRSVGSLTVPFHVQEHLNGSLFLDVQFQTIATNSGLPSSVFAIQ
jgi:hypothetical protein